MELSVPKAAYDPALEISIHLFFSGIIIPCNQRQGDIFQTGPGLPWQAVLGYVEFNG